MAMDAEDRLFVQVVGSKAVRTLKTRNIRLWNAFRERCEENSEKPESVLGRLLLKFVNSVLDGDSFHEELLDRTVNVTALTKKDNLIDTLNEILELKRKLTETGSDEIDKAIHKLITSEIERASKSPLEMITPAQQPQSKIVIDENLLHQLDPQSLDALAEMAKAVKEEKIKSMQVTSDQVEEVVEEEEKEVGEVAKEKEGKKEVEEEVEGAEEEIYEDEEVEEVGGEEEEEAV